MTEHSNKWPFAAKRFFCAAVFAVGVSSTAPAEERPPRRLAVASVHPLASDGAIAAFRGGGNAVDAAVTAALTLGVVDGQNSGIGGGCLILVRRPDGSLLAIDGREMAPSATTRDMFLRDGKPDTRLSQTGPLASGVPGAVAAYAKVLRECGARTLGQALAPGIEAAANGFPLSANTARALARKQEDLTRFPASREVFLHSDGTPLVEGEVVKQPDLAETYRRIAAEGEAWFLSWRLRQAHRRMDGRQRRVDHGRGLCQLPSEASRADRIELPWPDDNRLPPAQFGRGSHRPDAEHARGVRRRVRVRRGSSRGDSLSRRGHEAGVRRPRLLAW